MLKAPADSAMSIPEKLLLKKPPPWPDDFTDFGRVTNGCAYQGGELLRFGAGVGDGHGTGLSFNCSRIFQAESDVADVVGSGPNGSIEKRRRCCPGREW